MVAAPRQVSSRVRRDCPRLRQYCNAILTATSTETEPESQKNTFCSGSGGQLDQELREPGCGFVGEAAEHDVRHAPPHLNRGRGVEARVPVTVDRRPPRTHPVDHRPSVGEFEVNPPRRRRHHQRLGRRGQRPPVRMPDVLGVDTADLGLVHGALLLSVPPRDRLDTVQDS